MKLKEAYETIKVTPEEEGSIKRYLGFAHTSINILADLTPENYERLSKSGWKLPETEEELKSAITDFVNVYSAMYKQSKGQKSSSRLVRGTSRRDVPKTNEEVHQMLSTSTDRSVAKRFCKYGDAALIHVFVGENVPFLDAEQYRDENAATEDEVIISPFCKVVKNNYSGEYDGYAYYDIHLEKSELKEQTDEELQLAMNEIIQGFSEDIKNMKEYIRLEDSYDILTERIKKGVPDKEEKIYLNEKKEKIFGEYSQKSKEAKQFKEKLQKLLEGLCKQKELKIDKARNIIDADRKKKQDETQNEIRKNIFIELSTKVMKSPRESKELLEILINTYQELLESELSARRMAETLQIPFTKNINQIDIGNKIKQIEENVNRIQQKIDETMILPTDSLKSIQGVSKDIIPKLDGISYGLEIAQDIPKISAIYQTQTNEEIEKNLYKKVHKTIKSTKIKKYLQDRDSISAEGITFLGGLTGRNNLQIERLNNVNLKIKLAQVSEPDEQEKYSVIEMLADLYACVAVEFGGNFPPEMKQLYDTIKKAYYDKTREEFSDEYIVKIARDKIMKDASENLPVVHVKKSFWGKNKTQTELLKLENRKLELKIEEAKQKTANSTVLSSQIIEPDAVLVLDKKLQGIENSIREKSNIKDSKNTVRTFDLWG